MLANCTIKYGWYERSRSRAVTSRGARAVAAVVYMRSRGPTRRLRRVRRAIHIVRRLNVI